MLDCNNLRLGSAILALMIMVAFITFGLVWLWREQDILQAPRQKTEAWLATHGWVMTNLGFVKRRSKWAPIFRFAWKVLGCPFCLSFYVAFCATWFVLGVGLLRNVFWATWWGAWGLVYILNVAKGFLSEATIAAGAVSGWLNQPQQAPAEEERKPEEEDVVDDS